MRRRFTRDERAAFTVGTAVDWRNGRHWHPGVITDEAQRDSDGWDSVNVRNLARTGTGVPHGELLSMGPTLVRISASA